MRIAIIFPHLPIPEEEATTFDRAIRERFLSEELRRQGDDVFLAFLTNGENTFSRNTGDRVAHFFPFDGKKRRHVKFLTSSSLATSLKAFNADVVFF